MESFEIRKTNHEAPEKAWALDLRSYDGVEVSRSRVAWLTVGQASALAAHGDASLKIDAHAAFLLVRPPAAILISKVQDRQPLTLPWSFTIGDEPGHRLSDDIAISLADGGVASFEAGQPDWDVRRIEDLRDKRTEIERSLAQIDAAIEAAEEKLATRDAAKMDETPGM